MIPRKRIPWSGKTTLSNEERVARAVLYSRFLKRGKIKSGVFLRKDKDDDGLTVTNPEACTSEELCATFSECHGVVSLLVGAIREVGDGIDVRPDLDPSIHICDHANIIGLPYQSQDKDTAEYLAGLLSEAARIDWSRETSV